MKALKIRLKTMLQEQALIILPNHKLIQRIRENPDLIDRLPDYIVKAILRGFELAEANKRSEL